MEAEHAFIYLGLGIDREYHIGWDWDEPHIPSIIIGSGHCLPSSSFSLIIIASSSPRLSPLKNTVIHPSFQVRSALPPSPFPLHFQPPSLLLLASPDPASLLFSLLPLEDRLCLVRLRLGQGGISSSPEAWVFSISPASLPHADGHHHHWSLPPVITVGSLVIAPGF